MLDHNHKFYDRDDGLAHCMVCNGGEGSLPTHCPGCKMTADEGDAVYAGSLDFFNGEWVQKVECPKCARNWVSPCEQTVCIERHSECIICRFTTAGKSFNQHGSGEGTIEELNDISIAAFSERSKNEQRNV